MSAVNAELADEVRAAVVEHQPDFEPVSRLAARVACRHLAELLHDRAKAADKAGRSREFVAGLDAAAAEVAARGGLT